MTPTAVRVAEVWPEAPYKGLSYYDREDLPLFTGRKMDVRKCAHLLAQWSTRILVLHGRTGCGKSSFLRAGLIPFLEAPRRGFKFVTEGPNATKALFVRSTGSPLLKLAEAVFDFADGLKAEDMDSSVSLPRPKTLETFPDRPTFCLNSEANPAILIDVLSDLSSLHPRTLVIVLDQAEEVLTLVPGLIRSPSTAEPTSGSGSRSMERALQLGEFISRLCQTRIDFKLIVALRTEYYGEFEDAILPSLGFMNQSAVARYRLRDLEQVDLIKAIERPTQKEEVEGYGAPHDRYQFTYQQGLPDRIVTDLRRAVPEGGILPVMQIVCDRLFRAKKKESAGPQSMSLVIDSVDYDSLGGIEGQVSAHIHDVLSHWCDSCQLSSRDSAREIERWKAVLYQLVSLQPDGRATTKLKSQSEVEKAAKQANCQADVTKTLNHLADENQRILRRTDILDVGTKTSIRGYSLGHDALGLALNNWKTAKEQQTKARARLNVACAVLAIVGVMIVGIGGGTALINRSWWSVGAAVSGYGAALLAICSYLWLGFRLKLVRVVRPIVLIPLLTLGGLGLAGAGFVLIWTLLPTPLDQLFPPDDPRSGIASAVAEIRKAKVVRSNMKWEMTFLTFNADTRLAELRIVTQYTLKNVSPAEYKKEVVSSFMTSARFARDNEAVDGHLTVTNADGTTEMNEIIKINRGEQSNVFQYETEVILAAGESKTIRREEEYEIEIPYTDYLVSILPTQDLTLVMSFNDTGLTGQVLGELRNARPEEVEFPVQFPVQLRDNEGHEAKGPFLPYQGLEFTVFSSKSQ